MIIGLCGKKRVGKDTVADYLVNKYGFVKYSIVNINNYLILYFSLF